MAFSKKLPENRADYGISDLIYWHVLVYGTRPKGNPSSKVGWPWDLDSLAQLLGVDERTLRNWMSGKTRCTKLGELADELFGNNALFDEWRFELFEAYRKALLDESQTLSKRPEPTAKERSNSKDSPAVPSGRSDSAAVSTTAPGVEKPPNKDPDTADPSLTAPENHAAPPALSGADDAEASTMSNAEQERRRPAADAESAQIDNDDPGTGGARNSSTKNQNEETRVQITNPVVLRKNSSDRSSDRYSGYRKRVAIVGVGLTALLGFYAWISVPPPKPGKPSEGATSTTTPESARLSTTLTKSPSPTATPPPLMPPKQSTTAPSVPAAPSNNVPSTTLNSTTAAPTPIETKPTPLAPPPPVVQKPAEPVPAAPTTNVPAATPPPSASPTAAPIQLQPEAKPKPLPVAPIVTPQAAPESVPAAPTLNLPAPRSQIPASPPKTEPTADSPPIQSSKEPTPSAEPPTTKQDEDTKAGAERAAREKEAQQVAAANAQKRRECVATAQQTFRSTITELLPTLTSNIDYQESAARYFTRKPPKAFALCINWERSTPTKRAGDGFGFATLDSGDSPRLSNSQALASCIRSNGGSEGAKCCVIVDRDGQSVLTFPPAWPSSCN